MTPEEFRQHGHELIDWIARYLERVEDYPVLSQVKPGEVRAKLPASPPRGGGAVRRHPARRRRHHPARHHALAVAQLLRLLPLEQLVPLHPRRAALRPASASRGCSGPPAPPAPSSRRTSWTGSSTCWPCPTQFRSTATGGGVIQDTASTSSLVALLAARERATGGRSNAAGMQAAAGSSPTPRARRTHRSRRPSGSPASAATTCGWSMSTRLRHAPGPPRAQLIAADKAAGRLASRFVCATVGTTSSDAPSTLCRAIGAICREHGVWLHVDAAHGRDRRALPGVPLDPRRPGVRRQLRLQPAQVDADELRLQRLLRPRPGRAHPAPSASSRSTCATRPASPAP